MPFSFQERPLSRRQTTNPPSLVLHFIASGEVDDTVVLSHAAAATPNITFIASGKLYKNDIALDPEGHALYGVTVTYGPRNRTTGQYSFSFDTTGGTVKVSAARQHIASYPDNGDPNPHRGAIGVTRDGNVEGTEIVIPALKLTTTFRHPQGEVTIPYAKLLASVTGAFNANAFLFHDPGELLFLGATGSDGNEQEAEVSYHFASSQNATGLQIGDISGIAKLGHDYLWVEFRDQDDADGRASVRPRRVHVERLFNPVNFAAAFGWS